ncbi:TPA: hypothetical protein DD449_02355 [Candidatus Berkelbacteria bacterium]|nr:hypothetical protein [Candidatus Berkelbacteria bacterium]
MFSKKKQKGILRQPKIYTAPRDLEKKPMPKFLKLGIFVFIIVLVLLYIILFSPLFKIKNFDLMGNPSDESIAYIEQYKSKNIFSVSAKDIEEYLLEKNSQFSSVEVTLGIPSTLRIKFNERQPVLVWQSNGKNYLVDESAIAFKETDNASPDLILVTDNKNVPVSLPSRIVNSNFIDFLKNAKMKIGKLNLAITKFEVNETTFQVDAATDKNIKIFFDTTKSITDQIDAAQKVYEEKKNEITQYMDVRVEGKVYYQ